MKKLVIFDLDGTLLNTIEDLGQAANYALERNGYATHSMASYPYFVGNGVRRLMEQAVPEGTEAERFEAVLTTFRQHYLEHSLDATQPYPGIMEMLGRLKTAGKATAVVSNKFDAATKSLCRHFFGELVDVAIGESEQVRKKPAPDTVFAALKQLGVGKEDAAYVGDSDVDILTACNAGIPCISVLWGFRDRDFLISHGAQTFITHPAELLTIEKSNL